MDLNFLENAFVATIVFNTPTLIATLLAVKVARTAGKYAYAHGETFFKACLFALSVFITANILFLFLLLAGFISLGSFAFALVFGLLNPHFKWITLGIELCGALFLYITLRHAAPPVIPAAQLVKPKLLKLSPLIIAIGGAILLWQLHFVYRIYTLNIFVAEEQKRFNMEKSIKHATPSPAIQTAPSTSGIAANITSGKAPLTVTFSVKYMGLGSHWVEFGDGQKADVACSAYKPETDACIAYNQEISHTYTRSGTYRATYIEEDRGANGIQETDIGSVTITVQ